MANKLVLLVEDNPDDEALTLRALKASKVNGEVKVVRDGVEALDYLFAAGAYAGRDIAEMPAVILLDLNLPKIDGLEVLRRVRADPRTELLCVVVFTSSGEESDIQRAYGLRANSFIRKPVAFESFADTVQHLSQYWLRCNEPPVSLLGS